MTFFMYRIFTFKKTNILVGKSIFRMYMGSKQATKTRQKRSKKKTIGSRVHNLHLPSGSRVQNLNWFSSLLLY